MCGPGVLAEAAEQALNGSGQAAEQALNSGGQTDTDGTEDGENNAHGSVPFRKSDVMYVRALHGEDIPVGGAPLSIFT